MAKLAAAPEQRSVVLLLLALALLFATAIGRPHALGSMNTSMSLEYLTIAENRSPEHGFVGFRRLYLDGNGERAYELYNRFPIAGYLAIKAAILGFHDDMPAQIQAVRALMLAFFGGAMLAAYFSLKRLTASPSVALAATLLGFSSYYGLGIADMVATEGAMDLFAVMLTFHGLVVFVQQRRFAQLLAKACAAVLIGWHVFALLLPFILFSLAAEWRRGRDRMLRRAGRLLCSRQVALGAVALAVGVSMLALNFALERAALTSGERLAGAETTLAQLPSYQSMLRRTGQDSGFNANYSITFAATARRLFDYAGRASIPYAAEVAARTVLDLGHSAKQDARPLPPANGKAAAEMLPTPARDVAHGERQSPEVATASEQPRSDAARTVRREETRSLVATVVRFLGVLMFVASAVAIAFARHRVLLAALAVLGFCWCLLVPGFAHAPQEGKFFVGVPLVLYSVVLLQAQRRSQRLMNGCVGLALLVFSLSAAYLPFASGAAGGVDAVSALAADRKAIREAAPRRATIIGLAEPLGPVAGKAHSIAEDYLLIGRITLSPSDDEQRHRGDFVLADHLVDDAGLLTPDNRFYFLYERAAYDAAMAKRRAGMRSRNSPP